MELPQWIVSHIVVDPMEEGLSHDWDLLVTEVLLQLPHATLHVEDPLLEVGDPRRQLLIAESLNLLQHHHETLHRQRVED